MLLDFCFARNRPTVCVTGGWVGVDNAWEQEKARSQKNARKFVQRLALPACGRAWILLGSRTNSKPRKCL